MATVARRELNLSEEDYPNVKAKSNFASVFAAFKKVLKKNQQTGYGVTEQDVDDGFPDLAAINDRDFKNFEAWNEVYLPS